MNIVTCFKIVPDEADISVRADGELSFKGAKPAISSFDLNNIEEATRLFEAAGGTLTALSVSNATANDTKLRKNVLSRGPEKLCLVVDDAIEELDSHRTALVLKAAIEKNGPFDLILCGEGSADLYSQQVGIQLAQLLGVPVVNAVSKVTEAEEDGKLVLERTLEDEVETIELDLPAVVCVTSDINVPRIPGMKQILAAGKKPTEVLSLADLAVELPVSTIEALETRAPKQADRKRIVFEGDSDEVIQEFVQAIAKELK